MTYYCDEKERLLLTDQKHSITNYKSLKYTGRVGMGLINLI